MFEAVAGVLQETQPEQLDVVPACHQLPCMQAVVTAELGGVLAPAVLNGQIAWPSLMRYE